MSRAGSCALASALLFVGIGGACSSFTETDPGTSPDAATDADAETDAGLDADASTNGPDAAVNIPTLVATSDTNAIVDVRLDDTRVLWTTSTGTPWDLTSTNNLYAAPASGTLQMVGAGVTAFFAVGAKLGSLSADGTAGSAVVSQIGTTGLLEGIGPISLNTALMVGPLAIRLVESNQVLYWLSRDVMAGQTTVLSYAGTGQANTLKSLLDVSASDLAIEETQSGPIVLVTFATGIFGARVAGGGDLKMVVQDTSVTSITASRTGLYWTNVMGDVTYCDVNYDGSAPLTCAAPTTVLSVPMDPVVNVRFDHDALFAATAGGAIYECAATTCPNAAIVTRAPLFDAKEYRYGHTMAASDSELFWSEGSPNAPHRIMRIAR